MSSLKDKGTPHFNFLLASGNVHKCEELQSYLDSSFLTLEAAPLGLEVEETGETYFDNAKIKAKAYFDKYKRPCLADDSGLNVESLPDELGVRSARFGGEGLSSLDRCQLLLKKLEEGGNKNDIQRKAFFVCVLCFYLSHEEIYFFEGRLKGFIASALPVSKSAGFGYDPVFLPEVGGNMASFSLSEKIEWKNEHSHRKKAVKAAEKFLRGIAKFDQFI